MLGLFGNHIVGFPTKRFIYLLLSVYSVRLSSLTLVDAPRPSEKKLIWFFPACYLWIGILYLNHVSRVMRKQHFYICENKCADQLCSNCFCDCTGRFVLDLVRNPKDRFSRRRGSFYISVPGFQLFAGFLSVKTGVHESGMSWELNVL